MHRILFLLVCRIETAIDRSHLKVEFEQYRWEIAEKNPGVSEIVTKMQWNDIFACNSDDISLFLEAIWRRIVENERKKISHLRNLFSSKKVFYFVCYTNFGNGFLLLIFGIH